MATKAQINANRRNAKLSTGPRSDAGKAAVRQNALRHGFCSGIPAMQDENVEEFNQLHNLIVEENQPIGVNEEILTYMMAVNMHNFGRANLAIADALDAAEMDEQSVPPLPLALRYQQAAQRGFRQSLMDLRKLQKDRRLEEIGFDSQEPVEASAESAETPAAPPEPPPSAPPQAPKTEPATARDGVPAPVAAAPAPAHPVVTQNRSQNEPVNHPQTPPRAA